MTEEEAKQKWCPQVRLMPETNGWRPMTNREELIENPQGAKSHCIGSACMAWRNEIGPAMAENGLMYVTLQPTGHGYCGLAGKP